MLNHFRKHAHCRQTQPESDSASDCAASSHLLELAAELVERNGPVEGVIRWETGPPVATRSVALPLLKEQSHVQGLVVGAVAGGQIVRFHSGYVAPRAGAL